MTNLHILTTLENHTNLELEQIQKKYRKALNEYKQKKKEFADVTKELDGLIPIATSKNIKIPIMQRSISTKR